jgi:hypothetical protein
MLLKSDVRLYCHVVSFKEIETQTHTHANTMRAESTVTVKETRSDAPRGSMGEREAACIHNLVGRRSLAAAVYALPISNSALAVCNLQAAGSARAQDAALAGAHNSSW